jgi:hypothetical protein
VHGLTPWAGGQDGSIKAATAAAATATAPNNAGCINVVSAQSATWLSPHGGPKRDAPGGETTGRESCGAATRSPSPGRLPRGQQTQEQEDEDCEDLEHEATDARGRLQAMEVEEPGSGRGRKRQRKSAEQVSVLETQFSINPLPDKALRDRLGVQLGLTTRQVQIWFQNKVHNPTPFLTMPDLSAISPFLLLLLACSLLCAHTPSAPRRSRSSSRHSFPPSSQSGRSPFSLRYRTACSYSCGHLRRVAAWWLTSVLLMLPLA